MNQVCVARQLQLFALCLIAALATGGVAAAPGKRGAGDDAAVLTAQAERWDEALVAKDRAAIEANMADDFRQIGGSGSIKTKRAFVDELMAPGLKINPYAVEDFEIRLYGDTALLSGRSTMTGTSDGEAFETRYRFIDVYVRGSDGWKVVSVQITRIPK